MVSVDLHWDHSYIPQRVMVPAAAWRRFPPWMSRASVRATRRCAAVVASRARCRRLRLTAIYYGAFLFAHQGADRFGDNGRLIRALHSRSSPICMDLIDEAFVTRCGHSFWYEQRCPARHFPRIDNVAVRAFSYMCVKRHLDTRRDCPTCVQPLTRDQIFPNFNCTSILPLFLCCRVAGALTRRLFAPVNKVIAWHRQAGLVGQAGAAVALAHLLQGGTGLSRQEIDGLYDVIKSAKDQIDAGERQVENDVLLDFLYRTQRQKQEGRARLDQELQLLSEDIATVESRRRLVEYVLILESACLLYNAAILSPLFSIETLFFLLSIPLKRYFSSSLFH